MYVPRHFDESRVDVLHAFVHAHPFAVLVTPTADGLDANHLPFELAAEPAPFGTLRGHVARANSVWQRARPDAAALVIFSGPQSYVSPGWYATKAETGKAVPTWNYAAVHATGRIRFIEDAAWLRGLVERLTRRYEAGRPAPWTLDDAPADFIDAMLRAIVGVEMVVTRLVGKWKLGQNRPAADQEGMLRGLVEEGTPEATALSEIVRRVVTSIK